MRVRLLLLLTILGIAGIAAAVGHAQSGTLTIFTIAGGSDQGFAGDGGPASAASLNGPAGVEAAPDGTVFVADTINQRVRRIDPTGRITTFAGTGRIGFSGDGGAGTRAQFQDPTALAQGLDGSLYIADTGNSRIRVIRPNGVVATLAGTQDQGFSGDGGPSTAAQVNAPAGLTVGFDGSLFLSDTGNNRVRRIAPNGVITTVAGSGAAGFAGDGGPATAARLNAPMGLATAADGALLVADSGNNRVRRVGVDGVISTVAGNAGGGSGGDGGAATQAQLNIPVDVAAIGSGGFLVAEQGGNRIRRVDGAGNIARLTGAGGPRYGGDGRAAAPALLNSPRAVELMHTGADVLVADSDNNRMRYLAVPGQAALLALAPVRATMRAPLVRVRVMVDGRSRRTLVVRNVRIPVTVTKGARLRVRIATKRPVRRVASFATSLRAGRNHVRLPKRLRSGRRRLTKDHYVLTMTATAGPETARKTMGLTVR